MTEQRNSGLYWAASLAVVAVTTWIRYWFVSTGQLGLSPDEAQYWDWSRTLQWSYYSKGPLIAYINALGTALFGPTELGVRMGAVTGSLIMQLSVLVWIGLGWGRASTAFWTLVVLNTTALFMAGGLLMTTDNPLLVCWILGMICLSLALDKGHGASFVLLGLFVALGITAKYTMLIFIPLAAVTALWVGRSQALPPRFRPRLFKALGFGGAAGMLPILIWNATNNWAGIKHVLYRGGMAGEKAKVFFQLKYFPEYLGSQVGVLTPWWFVFLFIGAALVLFRLFSRGSEHPFPWLSRSHAILLTVFFWPVWLFFLFWSLHTKIEANWSATAYPAGILLAALAVERFMQRDSGSKWRWTWPVLGILVFMLLHLQAFIPFDGSKNPVHRLRGWQDLGLQIDRLMDAELESKDGTFVFSDSYGTTAALSFYVPGQQRAYCLPGRRKMNQYDFWPGPEGRFENAVFVVGGEKPDASQNILELFEQVDEARVVTTTQDKRLGQTFTLFVCRGYKGSWPAQERQTY